MKYADRHVVYAQGDSADALFYIVSGSVKVTIFSEYGKEAVIALLSAGDFFGEGCLDGQLLQNSTIAPRVPAKLYDSTARPSSARSTTIRSLQNCSCASSWSEIKSCRRI